ncbi:NAD(P)/FAD-dependent oxidoreductase [Chloroflexota bacterium]
MQAKYDVIIVGSGPAGIFAALELSRATNLKILLIEKGKDLENRKCPIIGKDLTCPPCVPCGLVSGWGGAGAFSDGKLTLSPNVGGLLAGYLGEEAAAELIQYVDSIYLYFGASDRVYGDSPETERLRQQAELAGLKLIPVPIRHMGTEHCREVLEEMRRFLADKVEIRTGVTAASILAEEGKVSGILTQDGQRLDTHCLIIAPGREGADWLVQEAIRLKLTLRQNPVDIGVRVEVPHVALKELTSALYEPKLEFHSPTTGDRIRTFCVCPAGEVTMETTGGQDSVITVNGHSYSHRKTANTNFALLVSSTFAPPFRDPIAYGRHIARLANLLSGGVIVQRWGDLKDYRCSSPESLSEGSVVPTLKSALPGELGYVLPYRFLTGIGEMLSAMDRLAPGVASPNTLLYGVEVKFYSSRLALSKHLESEISNLFAIGDGAGVTRGLIQAAASGVVVAREILGRVKQT